MAAAKSDSALQSAREGARRLSSFLVRCWVEGGDEGGGVIRGTICNLTTGVRIPFADAARVGDQIIRDLRANRGTKYRGEGNGGSGNGVDSAGCREGRDGRGGGVES